eukprot:5523650-Alexandrium_andersonii.AAC.1
MRWVPAHTGASQVRAGEISLADQRGNALADWYAKVAASRHPMPLECTERIERSTLITKLVAQHISRGLTAGSHWLGVDSLQDQRVPNQPSDPLALPFPPSALAQVGPSSSSSSAAGPSGALPVGRALDDEP